MIFKNDLAGRTIQKLTEKEIVCRYFAGPCTFLPVNSGKDFKVVRDMKVLFVWPGLTGYMGDCWRELSQRPGIELKISVDLGEKHVGGDFEASDVMRNLDWRERLPIGWAPDIVFSVGWHNALCREAAGRNWPLRTRKVCCVDMPWEWRVRKIVARFALHRYLKQFNAAFVNGKCAASYARWLGFNTSRIHTGLIGTNIKRFGEHKGGGGFLYVGRDVPEKGTDVLKNAHNLYKAHGGAWPLKIVGGISPNALGDIYAQADCFVLASRWEPWGVVLVEAAAAGLPIICTDKCGARFEVVRSNGLVVKSRDAEALAVAMHRIEDMPQSARLAMGAKGKSLAQPYSCQSWADRVVDICKGLLT